MIGLIVDVLIWRISSGLAKLEGVDEDRNNDVFIPFEDQCNHGTTQNQQPRTHEQDHFPEDFDDFGDF